jgi:prepilin-type N-terminal cleavage/methylation domain-containing protein
MRLAASLQRVASTIRRERGYTLVELLSVMAILALVMLGVTSLYLSGVRSQAKLTAQFQGEIALHVGLDKMRIDVHASCSQTAQSSTSITLSLPPCDGTNLVTWCTASNNGAYSLYRKIGSTCSGGTDFADYLTSGSVFTYTAQNSPAGSYAQPRLHVNMTFNADPTAASSAQFHVVDDLVFRNGARQ